MNTRGKLLSAMSAAAFTLAGLGAAQAQSFTNFGFAPPPAGNSYVQGGNNADQLGGGAYDLGWNFNGGFVGGAGNPYGPGTPPQGTQVAMLQGAASFAQSLGFAQAGSYQISFQAAQRAGQSQDIGVSMHGTTILPDFTPTTDSRVPYNTYQTFPVTAGQHNFTFNGLNTNGGDNTAFIDNVQLLPKQAAPQTIAIANPSFETYNSGVGYGAIDGWASSGQTGTNRGTNAAQRPFTNTSINPDGGEVAFIQGINTICSKTCPALSWASST